MARDIKKTASRRGERKESLPFSKKNYQILGGALVVIAAGYIALAQKPWDSAFPLVVAPILLVIGYCVLVPLGILYRDKKENGLTNSMTAQEGTATPPKSATS